MRQVFTPWESQLLNYSGNSTILIYACRHLPHEQWIPMKLEYTKDWSLNEICINTKDM